MSPGISWDLAGRDLSQIMFSSSCEYYRYFKRKNQVENAVIEKKNKYNILNC